jgi:hypothetical protein
MRAIDTCRGTWLHLYICLYLFMYCAQHTTYDKQQSYRLWTTECAVAIVSKRSHYIVLLRVLS